MSAPRVRWRRASRVPQRAAGRRDARFGFDALLWFVARRGSRIVGLALCDYDDAGRVAEFGVVPEHRRRGLGEALLPHGVAQLLDVGADVIEVEVDADNVTSAIAVYGRIGMVAQPAVTIGSRRITAVV